jgi:glycogen(starch) synthase
MKVALVARSVFPLHGYGGLERHVYDLARALLERDVEVTLVTQPPSSEEPVSAASIHPAIHAEFVPYHTFPYAGRRGTTVIDRSTAYPLFGLRAGRRALELVRAGKADIVHGLGATDPSRAPLKRAAYLPLRKSVLICAHAADAVIATDKSLEAVVLRHLGIPRERMHTIPNALDLPAVDALTDQATVGALRTRHKVGLGETVLLSVGRLEASKGFHVLLRAIAAVRDHGALERKPWRWVALGDGPYRPMLEALADELGLQDRVHFLGRVPDGELHAWHELSTLFVHPTLYEGSSLVTLEAMAHRRAVVASAAGGIPDKVRPGDNGWLVTPGDASGLAAAISGAVSDPARLGHYGLAGRRIVEREFSWTAAGDQTVALYRALLG